MKIRLISLFVSHIIFCRIYGSQLEPLNHKTYFKHVLSTILRGVPKDVQRVKQKKVAQEYDVPHLTEAQAKEYYSLDTCSARKKELETLRLAARTFYVDDQSDESYSKKIFNAMGAFNGKTLVCVLRAARINRQNERNKTSAEIDAEFKLLHEEPAIDKPWSYEKGIDRKQKMQLCKALFDNFDAILNDPTIAKDLPSMMKFIRLQTPEEPTPKQLPVMPLKYFNVVTHVLDSWRPHLEKHPVCAEIFKHIEYDLQKGNPFKYRSYDDGKPHRRPPTRLRVYAPGQKGFKTHIDSAEYDTQYNSPEPQPAPHLTLTTACETPRARREAMSPHSISYNALPGVDQQKSKEEAARAQGPQSAAAQPPQLSPVHCVLVTPIGTTATAAADSPHAAKPKKFEPFEVESGFKKAIKPPVEEFHEECVIG